MAERARRVTDPRTYIPAIALLMYAAWLLLTPPSFEQDLIGMLGVTIARAAAAFSLLAAARRRHQQRIWGYLGIAAALWAAGSALELGIRLMTGAPPSVPSAHDLIYLAGYLAALTGVVTYRQLSPERFGRVRELLDVAILVLAVVSLAWIIFIRPALAVGFSDPISLIWLAIAPTLALILVVLFARLAMRSVTRERAWNFMLITVAATILTLADLAAAYLRLQETATGTGFMMVGWIAAALIMMNVGLNVQASEEANPWRHAALRTAAFKIEPMLPLALTYVVVGSALLGWWLTRQVDWFTVALAASLSLLLVARQGVIIGQRELRQYATELEHALGEVADARGQLEQLNQRLEQKVSVRTAVLEKTVADLAKLNEELKELDQLKSEFVALVSHELRAPLTNIRTGIELLSERNPEIGSDRLHAIQAEIERLGALVEAILDISALEAGRFPLDIQAVELKEITDEVAAQLPDLQRLKQQISDELPLLMADERGLKSVLYHLLDNATKYAPSGDLVLNAQAEEAIIKVSLSDSGPGIPIEEQERVFEMFHRLDHSDAREVYGHGLGLPMARKLLEAMGGGIRAEAGIDTGARIVFWLPQAETN